MVFFYQQVVTLPWTLCPHSNIGFVLRHYAVHSQPRGAVADDRLQHVVYCENSELRAASSYMFASPKAQREKLPKLKTSASQVEMRVVKSQQFFITSTTSYIF